MKYFLARDFLVSGYIVRNQNWKEDEFLVLSRGGEFSFEHYDYTGLGVSPIANELLMKKIPKTHKNELIHIVPHLIKFNGFNEVMHDYVLDMKQQLIDEWGIITENYTDYLNWVSGTQLKGPKEEIGTVNQVFPDGTILVNVPGNPPAISSIYFLYVNGWRYYVNKKNVN